MSGPSTARNPEQNYDLHIVPTAPESVDRLKLEEKLVRTSRDREERVLSGKPSETPALVPANRREAVGVTVRIENEQEALKTLGSIFSVLENSDDLHERQILSVRFVIDDICKKYPQRSPEINGKIYDIQHRLEKLESSEADEEAMPPSGERVIPSVSSGKLTKPPISVQVRIGKETYGASVKGPGTAIEALEAIGRMIETNPIDAKEKAPVLKALADIEQVYGNMPTISKRIQSLRAIVWHEPLVTEDAPPTIRNLKSTQSSLRFANLKEAVQTLDDIEASLSNISDEERGYTLKLLSALLTQYKQNKAITRRAGYIIRELAEKASKPLAFPESLAEALENDIQRAEVLATLRQRDGINVMPLQTALGSKGITITQAQAKKIIQDLQAEGIIGPLVEMEDIEGVISMEHRIDHEALERKLSGKALQSLPSKVEAKPIGSDQAVVLNILKNSPLGIVNLASLQIALGRNDTPVDKAHAERILSNLEHDGIIGPLEKISVTNEVMETETIMGHHIRQSALAKKIAGTDRSAAAVEQPQELSILTPKERLAALKVLDMYVQQGSSSGDVAFSVKAFCNDLHLEEEAATRILKALHDDGVVSFDAPSQMWLIHYFDLILALAPASNDDDVDAPQNAVEPDTAVAPETKEIVVNRLYPTLQSTSEFRHVVKLLRLVKIAPNQVPAHQKKEYQDALTREFETTDVKAIRNQVMGVGNEFADFVRRPELLKDGKIDERELVAALVDVLGMDKINSDETLVQRAVQRLEERFKELVVTPAPAATAPEPPNIDTSLNQEQTDLMRLARTFDNLIETSPENADFKGNVRAIFDILAADPAKYPIDKAEIEDIQKDMNDLLLKEIPTALGIAQGTNSIADLVQKLSETGRRQKIRAMAKVKELVMSDKELGPVIDYFYDITGVNRPSAVAQPATSFNPDPVSGLDSNATGGGGGNGENNPPSSPTGGPPDDSTSGINTGDVDPSAENLLEDAKRVAIRDLMNRMGYDLTRQEPGVMAIQNVLTERDWTPDQLKSLEAFLKGAAFADDIEARFGGVPLAKLREEHEALSAELLTLNTRINAITGQLSRVGTEKNTRLQTLEAHILSLNTQLGRATTDAERERLTKQLEPLNAERTELASGIGDVTSAERDRLLRELAPLNRDKGRLDREIKDLNQAIERKTQKKGKETVYYRTSEQLLGMVMLHLAKLESGADTPDYARVLTDCQTQLDRAHDELTTERGGLEALTIGWLKPTLTDTLKAVIKKDPILKKITPEQVSVLTKSWDDSGGVDNWVRGLEGGEKEKMESVVPALIGHLAVAVNEGGGTRLKTLSLRRGRGLLQNLRQAVHKYSMNQAETASGNTMDKMNAYFSHYNQVNRRAGEVSADIVKKHYLKTCAKNGILMPAIAAGIGTGGVALAGLSGLGLATAGGLSAAATLGYSGFRVENPTAKKVLKNLALVSGAVGTATAATAMTALAIGASPLVGAGLLAGGGVLTAAAVKNRKALGEGALKHGPGALKTTAGLAARGVLATAGFFLSAGVGWMLSKSWRRAFGMHFDKYNYATA